MRIRTAAANTASLSSGRTRVEAHHAQTRRELCPFVCPAIFRRCSARSKSRATVQKVHAQAPTGVPDYVAKETFTNPTGQVIKPIRENLWKVDRPFVWLGIDVGSCMTVVKLQDGSLWVHSPVSLDKVLMAELAEIGPVKHIVSPNYEHLKYAAQWIDAYPDASSYACPGLMEMHPEIPYTTSVGVGNTTPASWPAEIEVTHMSHEVNPLSGKPFFNEVVFCHTPSKVMVTADFFWNWPKDVPFGTRAFKFGMDVFYKPLYFTFMIKHKEAYKSTMQRLMGLDWDTIIPCHGDPVYTDGKGVLRKFTGFA